MMEFPLVTSLERRAHTSIAATLWKRRDVCSEVADICFVSGRDSLYAGTGYRNHWLKLQNKVNTGVEKLALPDALSKELSRFVEIVGIEILHWHHFHSNQCKIIKKVPENFSWTTNGTIDLLGTAVTLIRDITIGVVNRYKLACMYCLDEHIFALWEELDEGSRHYMSHSEIGNELYPLVSFWTLYIQGRLDTLYSCSQENSKCFMGYSCGFYRSVISGNEVAARYFYHKLNEEEKNEILFETLLDLLKYLDRNLFHRHYTKVLCFILNTLNEEQQINALKGHAKTALKCFLHWPWQEHFMKLYQYVGHFLTDEGFFSLLEGIVTKRTKFYADYNYQHLFVELWQQNSSESNHQKFVVDSATKMPLLLSWLCELEDWQTFNLVLKDVSVEQKLQLLTCPKLYEAYKTLMLWGSFSTVESFVMECLLYREELIQFRDKMMKCYRCYRSKKKFSKANAKWKMLFKLLDKCLATNNKTYADEDGSESKKICLAEC